MEVVRESYVGDGDAGRFRAVLKMVAFILEGRETHDSWFNIYCFRMLAFFVLTLY
jgi:hypothetical protein